MTRLFQDIERVTLFGTLKYYLADDGLIRGSWKDLDQNCYFFNDIATDDIDKALPPLQGMTVKRPLRELTEELSEAGINSQIATQMIYQMFGHYVEEGNRL